MSGIDIIIGKRGSDHIRIRVVSRTEQPVRDYWDANWLATVVSINVGGWKGKNEKAYFRTEELSNLRAKIELISEGKLPDADFAPMEPHLQLKIVAENGDGTVFISGTALDRLEDGNTLSFRLAVDRAGLAVLATQLRAVEKAFPTIGKS